MEILFVVLDLDSSLFEVFEDGLTEDEALALTTAGGVFFDGRLHGSGDASLQFIIFAFSSHRFVPVNQPTSAICATIVAAGKIKMKQNRDSLLTPVPRVWHNYHHMRPPLIEELKARFPSGTKAAVKRLARRDKKSPSDILREAVVEKLAKAATA